MAKNTKYPEKTKEHTIYRNVDGLILPGVSTISNLLNTGDKVNILMAWSVKLFKLGVSYKEYTTYTGDVGTLAHYLINCHLLGKEPELQEYSKDVIEAAQKPYERYLDWFKAHDVEPVKTELQLVSESYKFGGTFDFFGKIDGKWVLADFKTSSFIKDEYEIQLAGYDILLLENGYYATYDDINEARIIRFSREGDYEERVIADLSTERQIFKRLVEIWWLQNEKEKRKYGTK